MAPIAILRSALRPASKAGAEALAHMRPKGQREPIDE